jgi:hypothetical protein
MAGWVPDGSEQYGSGSGCQGLQRTTTIRRRLTAIAVPIEEVATSAVFHGPIVMLHNPAATSISRDQAGGANPGWISPRAVRVAFVVLRSTLHEHGG